MGHESFDRKEPVSSSSNRSVWVRFRRGVHNHRPMAMALRRPRSASGAWSWARRSLGVPWLWPAALAPLNRVWTRFGLLLHRIVSPVVLGVMFFVVVTPTGLLMRALGKDPLRLRLTVTQRSYWIDRQPPGPAPDTLNNQF